MAECEWLTKCIFFNDKMASLPATAELMKSNYCKNNHTSCARYVVAKELGKEAVPIDLFPSETMKAKILLTKHGKAGI